MIRIPIFFFKKAKKKSNFVAKNELVVKVIISPLEIINYSFKIIFTKHDRGALENLIQSIQKLKPIMKIIGQNLHFPHHKIVFKLMNFR